eukprot:5644597-Pleurochrysis_carterae.AAC.1
MSCAVASKFDAKTMPCDVVRRVIVRASMERRAKSRNAGLNSMCETCVMLVGLGCSRRQSTRWPEIQYVCASARKRQPAAVSQCSLATTLNIRRRVSSRAQERGVEQARQQLTCAEHHETTNGAPCLSEQKNEHRKQGDGASRFTMFAVERMHDAGRSGSSDENDVGDQ